MNEDTIGRYGRDECRSGESDRGNVKESRSDVAVDEVADSFAKRRMTANKPITSQTQHTYPIQHTP